MYESKDDIQGPVHDIFPGFSGFGFCRKLMRTKIHQGIDKTSKHNGHTLLSWDLFLRAHQQEWCQISLYFSTTLFVYLSQI